MIARTLLVVGVALLLALQVVRNSAVAALSTLYPERAARFWAGHPQVEISRALADIGRAAREQREVGAATFALMDDAARKSPLSPEPYLVRGVQKQLAGDLPAAQKAFAAAQWRDPRSLPAAYFLADYYFRTGRALEGLQQTSILARLSPNGTEAVAPFVAAYARDRSNWPKLRALFLSQPVLEDGVLTALAQDAGNADAILAVADAQHRRPDSPWLRVLLGKLVEAGDYERARGIWSSVGRPSANPAGLLYDAAFEDGSAPPPFNWSLATSAVGLAERQPGSRLHLIFYGTQDGALASQLLLLAPGTYRLSFQLAGAPVHPEALRWSIRCEKATEPAASLRIDEVARRGWTFQVPRNCPAQWLELSGRSEDIAQQSEVTVGGLKLTRVAAHD